MLIAQISDLHIKAEGRLAYRKVDTAGMLAACVENLLSLVPRPDLVLITGDLVDIGTPEEYALYRRLVAPLPMPVYAVPGNHDAREPFRAAMGPDGYLPETGFLNFVIKGQPLRIIMLDTLNEGKASGLLCAERLDWLEKTLAAAPHQPTLIGLHHPPFVTGIAHMDRIGLEGAEAFAALVARHPQIEAITAGHIHRIISATLGGRRALIAPSPAHQVALDLTPEGPSAFRMDPPGYLLHHWNGRQLVTHTVFIGDFDGPYPFHGPDGRLID